MPDPVEHAAAQWLRTHEAAHRLLTEWARLEDVLNREKGEMTLTAAYNSDRAEAVRMREIDGAYEVLADWLAEEAGRIAAMPAVSRAGALAKIEMALTMVEPGEMAEPPWALVRSGVEDFRRAGSRLAR